MPDLKKMVRDRLRDCGLSPMRECEIVDEISQHLRDRYEAQLSNGVTEDAAEREIIEELEGRDLAGDLRKIEARWIEPVELGTGEGSDVWSRLWQEPRSVTGTLR